MLLLKFSNKIVQLTFKDDTKIIIDNDITQKVFFFDKNDKNFADFIKNYGDIELINLACPSQEKNIFEGIFGFLKIFTPFLTGFIIAVPLLKPSTPFAFGTAGLNNKETLPERIKNTIENF